MIPIWILWFIPYTFIAGALMPGMYRSFGPEREEGPEKFSMGVTACLGSAVWPLVGVVLGITKAIRWCNNSLIQTKNQIRNLEGRNMLLIEKNEKLESRMMMLEPSMLRKPPGTGLSVVKDD